MGDLITGKNLASKAIEKFLGRIRNFARSKVSFKKNIEVNVGHIAFNSVAKAQPARNAMTNERMASILVNGQLNERQCQFGHPIQIAVEGRFAEITVIAGDPPAETSENNAGFRVIVRQASPKSVIITVYQLNNEYSDKEIEQLPEVPHEIW